MLGEQKGCAHVDAELTIRLKLGTDDSGQRFNRPSRSWGVSVAVGQESSEATDAVAAHLRLGTISVEDAHAQVARSLWGKRKDQTIDQLLPVFLTLLKDEFPDVRLNIISKLDQVNQVIGVDLLSQELLPAIKDLAEDIHWRVRLAIIEYIPLLASQMGTAFLFQKGEGDKGGELNALCLQWLGDRVHSIREAAAVNLQKLTEVFGAEWACANILPRVMELMSNNHYLYRLTVVRAMTLLASAVGQDVAMRDIMPALKEATKDKVPNVRFAVAKALGDVAAALDPSVVEGEIKPALLELQQDQDVDVRFYAGQSLQLCDAKLSA